MRTETLDRKYRPKTFEDVWGQERCVNYLSQLILREAKPRNILLHGSVGSGKTSLARIYSVALNCDSPSEKGSPCWRCPACLTPAEEHRQEYDVPGRGAEPEAVREWLSIWNRPPVGLRCRTLFLDEAHALKPTSADVMLKAVEEPAEGVVFVFATTEIESMRAALLSRLAQLEVVPLTPEGSIDFLRRYADAEHMTYDLAALALLAGLKNGYPRDLLIGLEQVHGGASARITVPRVKQVFDLDHTDILVEYFCALAGRDPVEQFRIFQSWREPTESKLRWVQCLLLALYYAHVLQSEVVVDPLIRSIDALSIGRILQTFRMRFGVQSNRDLHQAFRAMVEFWATPNVVSAEGAMLLRVAAFHDLVNSPLNLGASASPVMRITTGEGHGPGRTHPSLGMDRQELETGQDRFMSTSDVREMIHCASFLPQQHGVLFGWRFDLRPDSFGVKDERKAYHLIRDFCDELQAGGALGAGSDEVFYLAQVERDQMGLRAAILAHLGASLTSDRAGHMVAVRLAAFESWLRAWRFADRTHGDALSSKKFGTHQSVLRDHWESVLDICAGLGSDDAIDGLSEPLLDLLQISKRMRRSPGPVRGPVFLTSANLSRAAVAVAAEDKMGFLSAFDDHAWTRLKDGWELDEFNHRKAELQRRREDVERIRRAYGRESAECLAKVDALRASWPDDPRDRQRSWTGWWRRERV